MNHGSQDSRPQVRIGRMLGLAFAFALLVIAAIFVGAWFTEGQSFIYNTY